MPDDLMPVATFVRPSEAAAAKTALEAEGMLCFLKDENIISMDWLLGNAVGYVKLLVPAADVERARALLDAPFHWPQGELDGQAVALCPGCGRGRVAICPYCRTTGSNFAAADNIAIDATEDEPPLVICPTCDEPFEPEYLRRCEWCGHDFGTGAEPPQIVRASEREPINWRVVLASLTGVAVIVAIIAYFAVLLS